MPPARVWPPLSEVNTMSVLSMPAAARARVMLPMASSMAVTMPQ